MYLHIGQDWMIPIPEIIGIFQEDLLTQSAELRHLFLRWRGEGRVFGDPVEAKTVVLTDERLFLTSISTHTLMRRAAKVESLFESD